MQICREMRPCTGTASAIAVFSENAFTGFLCACQFYTKNELLTRLGPVLVPNKLATVRYVLTLTPTEMRTRQVGFWKKEGSARYSPRV